MMPSSCLGGTGIMPDARDNLSAVLLPGYSAMCPPSLMRSLPARSIQDHQERHKSGGSEQVRPFALASVVEGDKCSRKRRQSCVASSLNRVDEEDVASGSESEISSISRETLERNARESKSSYSCCSGSRPWYERPIRALAISLFLAFVWVQTFPFFMAMSSRFGGEGSVWDEIFELMDSAEPIVLAVLTVLAAIAGSHAHAQKQPAVSGKIVHLCIHVINIAPLVCTVPWWWPGSFKAAGSNSAVSDLAEGLAYMSGVLCRIDMGLCLLPIARASPWLNSAGVAFPEGIPFHRVTGWWCIGQVQLLVYRHTPINWVAIFPNDAVAMCCRF